MRPRWYVIHSYAGYENKVKLNLEHRKESMNMGDKIFDIYIPTEDIMEVYGGKKHVSTKKVFLVIYWLKCCLMMILGMLFETLQG